MMCVGLLQYSSKMLQQGRRVFNFLGFLSGHREVKDTQSTHAKQEYRGVWSVLNSNRGDIPQAI